MPRAHCAPPAIRERRPVSVESPIDPGVVDDIARGARSLVIRARADSLVLRHGPRWRIVFRARADALPRVTRQVDALCVDFDPESSALGARTALHVTLPRDLAEIDARLESGQIHAAIRAASTRLEVDRGEIEFWLWGARSVRVDAQTRQGAVLSDIPLVQVGRSGPLGLNSTRMVGGTGRGGLPVQALLRVGRGNIVVRRRPPASARRTGGPGESVEADQAVAADPAVLQVLQALARGELTADQADRRLARGGH
jgi:hypothetical protein